MTLSGGWEGAAFVLGILAVLTAWVAAIVGEVWEARDPLGRTRRGVATVFYAALIAGVSAQVVTLLALSLSRGTIAVYNQAEFMLAFSTVVCILVGFFLHRRRRWWVPVAVAPISFVTLGWILLLPEGTGEVSLASMRSMWLLLHILTSVVAYAAFTVTFGAGVFFLLRRHLGVGSRYKAEEISRVGYRAAVFGFPFMTMVILTGALWAKYKFGVYWSWDPIEVWSLVTWLAYSAYLHAQYNRGWEGSRAAWLSIVGYGTVVCTYLFFSHFWI